MIFCLLLNIHEQKNPPKFEEFMLYFKGFAFIEVFLLYIGKTQLLY